MINNYYIHQVKGYAIGNFINCTPTIQFLANYYQTKIKVLFYDKIVERMYLNCNFIEIITEKEADDLILLFSSKMVNALIPDWQFIFKKVIRKLRIKASNKDIPHTYVDTKIIPKEYQNKEYVVILRGHAEGSGWLDKKDPGDDIYKYFLEKISQKYLIVFIGADIDYDRYINYMKDWVQKSNIELNDIEKSLGLILGAKFIIGNDTGMYHVAGAYNRPVFVFWKDSLYPKSKSPGKGCVFSFKTNWYNDFDKWEERGFDAYHFAKFNPKRKPNWWNRIKL
jgi:ADP-heptose:LPS heptosyltransferase